MKNKQLWIISILYFILWSILAINPLYRPEWLLENYIVFTFWGIMLYSLKKFPLSNLTYYYIFVYLGFHSFGAHYGYTNVPFGFYLSDIFHQTRANSYDRLVHFLFGFLLTYPIFELLKKHSNLKGLWIILLPSEFILSMSAVYELIEAFVAWSLPAQDYDPFVGLQGDIWDGFKDMLLAFIGSLLITLFNLIKYLINKRERF